jgi:hypothetical protein
MLMCFSGERVVSSRYGMVIRLTAFELQTLVAKLSGPLSLRNTLMLLLGKANCTAMLQFRYLCSLTRLK